MGADGRSPLTLWPFDQFDWPMGAGPEIWPYSTRTFVFMFVYLLFSGNLGRAFFPMLFFLLLEPNLMKDPSYRKFCGDSDEAVGTTVDASGPYASGYRNHEVANDWVRAGSALASLCAPLATMPPAGRYC